MRKILFFDTTLRDGEQTPGVSLNVNDKTRIAQQIHRLGADIIEAGFPASSPGEFKATQKIASQLENVKVCALCRALREDIDRAYEALSVAKNPRLHVFVATSDLHLQYKLHKSREEVLEMIADSVSYARTLCDDIQFSAEDGARSDPEFLISAYNTAILAGATTINIVDTVGYMLPYEFGAFVSKIIEGTSAAAAGKNIVYGAHCHNDLGMAVANTLEAVRNGVTQVDVTVNGIGERAGNASFEELVMAFTTRAKSLDICHGIDTTQINRTSKLVSSIIGIPVPAIKPIVGKNTFSHESGIHQHGILNNSLTYEIFTPQSIGISESSIVLGKLSGRHAFDEKAVEMGYHLEPEVADIAFHNFKEIADTRKGIAEADIRAIIESAISDSLIKDGYTLESFQIQSGNKIKSMAMIVLSKSGKIYEEAATGNGPIEAAFNAVNRIVKKSYNLEAYSIKAVTEGKDALGEVNVRISDSEGDYAGRGVSRDIIKASIRAYVNAINRIGIYLHRD